MTFIGLFMSQMLHAQISIGVRGGFLVTSVDKTPLEPGESAPGNIGGYQLAIPVEIKIGNLFAFQPELMIGTHGALEERRSSSTQIGITTVSSIKAKYYVSALEIPLLAKFSFGQQKLQFQLLAGPSIGFGVKGEYKVDASLRSTLADGTVLLNQTSSDTYTAKFLPDGFKTTELGTKEFAVNPVNLNLHIGAGISINLGGPKLFMDIRYIAGLSDFRPEAEGDTKDVVYKSKRIGLSLGLMFPL